MKNRLMILGAGIYQVPLIRKAKEMGYYTVVASVKGDYPGFGLADKAYYVSTTDFKEILKISEDENIVGICTTGTDVAVCTLGIVCDSLKLSGVSRDAAEKCTNKFYMKECFLKSGVKTAAFRKVASEEEALVASKEIGYPVMLKVVDKSGSRGIVKANNEKDICRYFWEIKSVTQKGYMLVEKYIEGEEIGVDAFVQNGELLFLAPHKKLMFNDGRRSVPIGHYVPFEGEIGLYNKIYKQIELAVQALGLDNCAVNADVFLSNEEVYIIEMGGRAGATGIPEIISECYGIDYYEKIIEAAVGKKVTFDGISNVPCMSYLLFSPKKGVLKGKRDNCTIEGVKVQFDYDLGQEVNQFKNGTDRIGQVIIKGKTIKELKSKLDNVKQEVLFTVD